MIKFSTFLAIGCLVAATVFSAPKISKIVSNTKTIRENEKLADGFAKQLKDVNAGLQEYKAKFDGKNLQTNIDVAKSMATLPGCTFKTVTAIAVVDGETYTVCETADPEQVSFFSSYTKQMRFELGVSDITACINGLKSSTISVDEFSYDGPTKTAYVTVPAVFTDVNQNEQSPQEGSGNVNTEETE